jgi:hypothetical protein
MINKHNKNFNNVPQRTPKAKMLSNDQQWGTFLAGLIDADGHINKLGYVIIIFDLSNLDCAYMVKHKIGFGRISRVSHKKAAAQQFGCLVKGGVE